MNLYLAQLDVLTDNIEIARDTAAGWDELWLAIYGRRNILWTSIQQFALFLVSLCFVWFGVKFTSEVLQKRLIPSFQHLLWILVVLSLMANNAALLASGTLGLRNFIDAQTRGILEIQVGRVAMDTAIRDVLITGDVKSQITALLTDCEAKTGTAQIDCFNQGGQDAQRIIQNAEQRFGPLSGLARFWQRLQQATAGGSRTGQIANPASMVLVGTLLEAGLRLLLKACQWAFTNGVELAMLITGLFGPIAVATSCLPTDFRPLWTWLAGFWGLALVSFSYNVMLGLVATVYTLSDLQTYSDVGFLVFIGVIAPFMALALGAGGGFAILRALTGLGSFIVSLF